MKTDDLPAALRELSQDDLVALKELVDKKAWLSATTIAPFTSKEQQAIADAKRQTGDVAQRRVRDRFYQRKHWDSLRWFLFGGLVDITGLPIDPNQAYDPDHNPWVKVRVSGWAQTLDEHDEANPYKTLPDKDYLRLLSYAWVFEPLLLVPKSRQVMVTWLFCCIATHNLLVRPAQRMAVISKKFEDADSLIDRMETIYNRLPHSRFSVPAAFDKHRKSGEVSCPQMESIVQAMGEEAKGLRQYTFSWVLCVSPQTRVLTNNFHWVQAGNVQQGDVLAGFDEEDSPNRRMWRNARVERVVRVTRPAYRLTLEDGTQVDCSGEHRWLVKASNIGVWRRTDEMRPNYGKMSTKLIRLVDTWQEGDSYEEGYLAAAFDGEGNIRQKNIGPSSYAFQIAFAQNDNGMYEAVQEYLKKLGFEVSIYHKESERYSSTHHHLYLKGRAELFRFLGQVRPKRLLDLIDLDKCGAVGRVDAVKLVDMEYLGEQTLVGLTTSTGTFVAEGLASHNSDEVAFQEQADDIFRAAMPTVKGGGRFTGVSTPNGEEVFHSTLSENGRIPVPAGA